MNYAKQVAEMLGLEIGEKFKIKGHQDLGTFWFVEDGSMGARDIWQYDAGSELYASDFEPEVLLEQILTGLYEIEKFPWKPKEGEIYYSYTNDGFTEMIAHIAWVGDVIDLTNWKAGNCFKTEEEAEAKGKETIEQIRKEYEEA